MTGFLAKLKLRRRGIGLTLGLVVALGLIGMVTVVEATSRPAFCGSCHVMTPYYESWKTSSHKNIACVECHIAPGVTAEIRKKWEALSMVARYFTGTYGTNPWAEIDDAACLKCHERRLLSGKELFGDVLFDHASHLVGMRNGKTLRCTSCHSQIVQGSHMTVTTSTCILCHFKGQASGTGTARCTLCHVVPDKVIQRGTLTFNHADVSRHGMDCNWCHSRPAGSDGGVLRERCVTCHNEPDRLEKYGDSQLMHRTHVTEHKVDCTHCHSEIEHVGPARIERAVTNCDSCHKGGHSPQLTLYSGVGGRGVEPRASAMFEAGIRCEGCHFELPGQQSDVHRAGEVSCMSCHGPSYRKVLLAWQEREKVRTGAIDKLLTETTAALAGKEPPALVDARFNFDLVRRGRAVHNVDYADSLLRRAHQDLNTARKEAGLAEVPLPWVEVPYQSACLRCHQGIETRQGQVFGKAFRHEVHVAKAGVDCAECHRPHEERPKHEVLKFGPEGCVSCHHSKPDIECTTCHQGVLTGTVQSSLGQFSHKLHVEDQGLDDCSSCHDLKPGQPPKVKEQGCALCHKKK